jgi:hypothetical protein
VVGLVGKRDPEAANRVIDLIDRRTGGKPPVFVTDGWYLYPEAITSVYTRPRGMFASKLLRGSFTHAGFQSGLKLQTPDLWHLRVIKYHSDQENDLMEFPTLRLTREGQLVDLELLEEITIPVARHTNHIERRNFTQRRRCAVLQRKSSSVTQDKHCLQDQVTLERFSYNYCQSHRSLRQYRPDGKKQWKKVTPAMKLAVTGHIWTLQEALGISLLRIPEREKKTFVPPRTLLPEPSVVKIHVKEYLDWKILKNLVSAGHQGLERSELCHRVHASRTTVYDHLALLKAKSLVIESRKERKSVGRPKTIFYCPWPVVHLSHAEKNGTSVLVSNTN